jgi:solute carrier family 25 (mitochondrial 2-oxodicarboxylate transporter), member 21
VRSLPRAQSAARQEVEFRHIVYAVQGCKVVNDSFFGRSLSSTLILAPISEAMSPPPVPRPLTMRERLLAGGCAGLTELAVMYPLDVVKTRAQLDTSRAGAPGAGPSTLARLRLLIASEGPVGMYRGVLPPALMETPKRAIKFAANEAAAGHLRRGSATGELSQARAAAAGISAGIAEAFFVVPFELVKIRLQDVTSRARFSGATDVVLDVLRTRGPVGLYQGLESTLWRQSVWNGGYFGLIFAVRRRLPAAESESQRLRNNFVAGTISGAFGTSLNTPIDVVKSRIQNQVPGQPVKYSWTLSALATVAREEGFVVAKSLAPLYLYLSVWPFSLTYDPSHATEKNLVRPVSIPLSPFRTYQRSIRIR